VAISLDHVNEGGLFGAVNSEIRWRHFGRGRLSSGIECSMLRRELIGGGGRIVDWLRIYISGLSPTVRHADDMSVAVLQLRMTPAVGDAAATINGGLCFGKLEKDVGVAEEGKQR